MLTRFGHALRNHDCTVRHATSLLKFVVFLPLRGVMLYAMMRSDFPFLRKARFLLSSSRNIANHPVGAKFNESLTMKKSLLVLAVAATFAAGFARADEVAPAEVKPDNEVAFNVGVTTDIATEFLATKVGVTTDISEQMLAGNVGVTTDIGNQISAATILAGTTSAALVKQEIADLGSTAPTKDQVAAAIATLETGPGGIAELTATLNDLTNVKLPSMHGAQRRNT